MRSNDAIDVERGEALRALPGNRLETCVVWAQRINLRERMRSSDRWGNDYA